MRVVDARGEIHDVPEESGWQGLLSGEYGLEPGSTVPVRDRGGNIGSLKAEDLATHLAKGQVTPATGADLQKAQEEARFSGALPTAIAAGHGLVDTATLGGYTALMRQSGLMTEEDLANLKGIDEAHPVAKLAGDIGGIVAQDIITGGAAEYARAVQLPRLAQALRYGETAEGFAAQGLRAAGVEGGSLLARGAQHVIPAAVRGAAEGAIQGFGQAVTEAQLNAGDHELTAEKVLASMGHGAIWGGAMGAGVGGLGLASGEVKTALQRRVAGMSESSLIDHAVDLYAQGAGFMTGKDPAAVKQLLKDSAFREMAVKDPEAVFAHWSREIAKDANAVDDTTRMLRDLVWGEGKRIQTKALVPEAKAIEIQQSALGTVAQIRRNVSEMAGNAAYFPNQARVKKALDAVDEAQRFIEIQTARGGKDMGGAIFSELDWLKRKFGRMAKPNQFLGVDTTVEGRMRDLYDGVLKPHLEDVSLYGKAAEAQQAVNGVAKHQFGTAHEFEKRFGASTGNKDPIDEWMDLSRADPGKMQSTLRSLGDPESDIAAQVMRDHADHTISTLEAYKQHYTLEPAVVQQIGDAVEKAKALKATLVSAEEHVGAIKTLQSLESGAKPFGSNLDVAGALVGGPVGMVVGGAAKAGLGALQDPANLIRKIAFIQKLSSGVDLGFDGAIRGLLRSGTETTARVIPPATVRALGATPDERAKNYERERKQIEATLADPGRVNLHAMHLEDAAPNVARAIVQRALSNAQYLASKMPPAPQRATLQPTLQRASPPDDEISKWGRYFSAVNDPKSVIEDARHGQLSREQVEALRDTSPKLYEQMQRQVMAHVDDLSRKGHPLSYEQRVALSSLMGIPADQSMTAGFQTSAQAAFASAAQAQGGPQMPAQPSKPVSNAGQKMRTSRYGALSAAIEKGIT